MHVPCCLQLLQELQRQVLPALEPEQQVQRLALVRLVLVRALQLVQERQLPEPARLQVQEQEQVRLRLSPVLQQGPLTLPILPVTGPARLR